MDHAHNHLNFGSSGAVILARLALLEHWVERWRSETKKRDVQPHEAPASRSFEDALLEPLEPIRAMLEKNWLANFENTEPVECYQCTGKGHIDSARPGGYVRRSAFNCCSGGGHGDAAGREGRIGGGHP